MFAALRARTHLDGRAADLNRRLRFGLQIEPPGGRGFFAPVRWVDDQVLAVDEAIGALEQNFPRAAEVVRLRFFAGLSEPDAARALEISERTVRREWTFARAWLLRYLEEL